MKTLFTDKEITAIHEILIQELEVERRQLTPDARIIEDLGADSLSVIEINMALEDRFGISIPDEELEHVSTVQDLIDLVCKHTANS